MNISREQYEQAVITVLSPLLIDNGGYLYSIAGYAGQFDRDEALQLWLGRLPALLVLLNEATFPDRSTHYWQERLELVILVGARSWRSQEESRNIGISQIFQDLRLFLLNKDLGLAIRPLEITGERIIDSDINLVVGSAEYLIINDRVMGG